MAKELLFLHTSPAHIATFDTLLAQIDLSIPARHVVDERLLHEARETGITPALEQRIALALHAAWSTDTAVALCTCSTIGGCAEQLGAIRDQPVLRVDRAMAERAVLLGSRILVAAALSSTLGPTRDLLRAVAAQANKHITLQEIHCEDAWADFERGDHTAYHQAIAGQLRLAAGSGDVIVLAQASMAGATAYCADLSIPILSSPQLGLEAAIRVYREHAASDD